MSHDGKAGKRKITQSKTPKSSSKTPSPSDQLQPDQPAAPGTEGPAGTMAGQNVHLEAYVWQENVDGKFVLIRLTSLPNFVLRFYRAVIIPNLRYILYMFRNPEGHSKPGNCDLSQWFGGKFASNYCLTLNYMIFKYIMT